MQWMAATLAKYPEIAMFFTVGIGYWLGSIKVMGFTLGPVTGSLLVGLVVGYVFPITVSSMAKSTMFMLFLFAIGYSVGRVDRHTMAGHPHGTPCAAPGRR